MRGRARGRGRTNRVGLVDTGVATVDVTGSALEGETLTATFNDNDPDGPATGIAYQWIRGAATIIGGATADTYAIQLADIGSTLKVRVNYIDANDFAAEIFSANTAVVAAVDSGDATVDIAGTEQSGETLTATFNDDDPDGAATGITYQWIRDANTTITGETNSTYLLDAADEGHTVKVRIDYTDGQGFAEQIESADTGTISAPVTPGSQTFDTGSGNFEVPNYNTLEIELWGGGGASCTLNATGAIVAPGTDGGQSSVVIGATTLQANGGTKSTGGIRPNNTTIGAAGNGGTAANGDTNTTGNNGGQGSNTGQSTPYTGGSGGASPNGGATRAGLTDSDTLAANLVNGQAGNAPGGGAAGGANTTAGNTGYHIFGGGGGGYSKKTYIRDVTSGAPDITDLLAYVVAAGGVGGTDANVSGADGASGAPGRVKFTWS